MAGIKTFIAVNQCGFIDRQQFHAAFFIQQGWVNTSM